MVGIEREMTHKAAGVRTHALVGLGAAAPTVAGFAVLQVPGAAEFKPAARGMVVMVTAGMRVIEHVLHRPGSRRAASSDDAT